jgi:hypothetical protein
MALTSVWEYSGAYYLAAEFNDATRGWTQYLYTASSPTGTFSISPGPPPLRNGSACLYQETIGSLLYLFNCYYDGSTWHLQEQSVDPTTAQNSYHTLNTTKWPTPSTGSTWQAGYPFIYNSIGHVTTAVLTGAIGAGSGSGTEYNVLSSYTCTACVFQIGGAQITGTPNWWALDVRASSIADLYGSFLYNNHNGSNNLYIYVEPYSINPSGLGKGNSGNVTVGNTDTLTMSANGSAFTASRNGTQYATGTDSTYSSGHVAMHILGTGTVQFTNALVYKFATALPTISAVEIY